MGRRVKKNSIANIASEAGVSAFAVSCVINNRPGVSNSTRQKIQKILKQVGYTRNYKLSSGRTIGLVIPGAWDDWYISALVRGVLAYSSQEDCSIATIIHHPESNKSLLEELRLHSCDAAIIAMPEHMRHEIKVVVNKTNMPMVLMDSRGNEIELKSKANSRVGYVDNNSFQGSFDMCKYLISLKHRRIAFVYRRLSWLSENQQARIKGWQDAMLENGMSTSEINELLIEANSNNIDKISFKEKHITAVMCTDDNMAMSCLRLCYEKHIRVPEELTVTGFGNMSISSKMAPPLTTVDQNVSEVAYKATEYAYELVTGKCSEAPNLVIPTELVIRKSSCGIDK